MFLSLLGAAVRSGAGRERRARHACNRAGARDSSAATVRRDGAASRSAHGSHATAGHVQAAAGEGRAAGRTAEGPQVRHSICENHSFCADKVYLIYSTCTCNSKLYCCCFQEMKTTLGAADSKDEMKPAEATEADDAASAANQVRVQLRQSELHIFMIS